MKYYLTDSVGNLTPSEGKGFLNRTEDLTEDRTLVASDSGKTFLLDAIGEAITLPSPLAGLKYKFICAITTATSNWTITSATSVIYGSAEVAGAIVAASAENTITLVIAKFLPGDSITLESDGTNWYVNGNVVTALGVTFTVV